MSRTRARKVLSKREKAQKTAENLRKQQQVKRLERLKRRESGLNN